MRKTRKSFKLVATTTISSHKVKEGRRRKENGYIGERGSTDKKDKAGKSVEGEREAAESLLAVEVRGESPGQYLYDPHSAGSPPGNISCPRVSVDQSH